MHESENWKWSRSVVSNSSDPMDCSLPGSSVHGIFQAGVLEWGAIAFSEASPYKVLIQVTGERVALQWRSSTDTTTLTKGSKRRSPVTGHADSTGHLVWGPERDTASLLWCFFQKGNHEPNHKETSKKKKKIQVEEAPPNDRSVFFKIIKTMKQRRQWHPTPVLLPRKSHRQRSLVGCSPWGRWGSGMTERLHFHALEKEMATHSSVLARRIPGMGEPGGLPSMGSHRVGHDWSDLVVVVVVVRPWKTDQLNCSRLKKTKETP